MVLLLFLIRCSRLKDESSLPVCPTACRPTRHNRHMYQHMYWHIWGHKERTLGTGWELAGN
jgi:hypothetical protein